MLSRADLDIISRDSRLPGLALLLDIGLLSEQLGLSLEKLTYLNYKPGTSCTASVVDVTGTAYAVMAYPRERFTEVRARGEWTNGSVKAQWLDNVCVVLVPMTLDRHIRAARKMTGSEAQESFFRKLLSVEEADDRLDTIVLRYKPNRRIVLRLHVAGYPRALIKCFDRRGFDNALMGAELCALLSGVPQLGVNHRRHTIATAWVNGQSLCPVLSGQLHCEAFAATGRWLAQLHASPPDVQLPFARETRTSLTSPLFGIAQDYPKLLPDTASTLVSLARTINEACSCTPMLLTLIHGDFSADQVIVAERHEAEGEHSEIQPVVIDWDRAMVGSPLRDVGSFLARLEYQSLDGSLGETFARCAQQAFVDGYRECLPDTERRLIHAFHARALLLLIFDGFRHRHANWHELADALLRRVESLVRQAAARPREEAVTQKPALLAAALNIEEMRKPMKQLMASQCDAMLLESAQLLRHKPGRRALIRYELRRVSRSLVSQELSVLGKLRFRKADLQTPALHDLLRAQGLNGSNPQGVGVPANLGVFSAGNIWFQAVVPGKELSQYLKSGADIAPFTLAGRALAVFHSTPVTSPRSWSLQNEADVLTKALDKAVIACPELKDRIIALRHLSLRAFDSLPAVTAQLIHRDFYQDQLLMDGSRVWILDLDLVAQGDPAIDIGNFLAHIKEYSLRRYGCVSALQSIEQAFMKGYMLEGCAVDERRIKLLEALSLARHLYISTLFAERVHTTDALLTCCEEQLASLVADDSVLC